MYVCMYVCMYVRMYVHVYVYIMYVHVLHCTYVRTYIHLTCMYASLSYRLPYPITSAAKPWNSHAGENHSSIITFIFTTVQASHIRMYIHIHTCMSYVHTYMYVICTYIHHFLSCVYFGIALLYTSVALVVCFRLKIVGVPRGCWT